MKKFFNAQGMTLVEVMVAGGLVAGLAVAGMTMFKTQTTAQKTVEQNYEVMAVNSQIRKFLSIPNNCQQSLGGRPITVAAGTITRLSLYPGGAGNDRFISNTPQPGNVRIVSYALDATVPGLEPLQTALKISYSRGNNTLKDSVQKIIAISYTLSGGLIQSCFAAENQQDSFWIQAANPLDIFYMTGNVGIGTATPGAKLEVKAGAEGQAGPAEAIRIWGPNNPATANSAQDIRYTFAAAGSARIRAYRGASWDTYLEFLTNPNAGSDNPVTRMHINHEGKVGIGTSAPTARLHVDSYQTDPATIFNNIMSYTTFAPTAVNAADLWGQNLVVNYASASAGNRILGAHFSTQVTSSGAANMIGLAGVADNYSTAVVPDAVGTYARAGNNGAGSISGAKAIVANVINGGSGSILNGTGVYIDAIQATNKWGLYQADTTANNYFGGNVGIGETVPLARLHMADAVATGTSFMIQNNTASGRRYGFISSGTGSAGGVGKFHLYDWSANNSRMVIDSNGYVGIGTTNPPVRLSNTATSFPGGVATDGLNWLTSQNDYAMAVRAAPATGAGYGLRLHTDGATGADFPLFITSGAGVGTVRLAVRGDGNVGIGTDNPLAKLHVAGSRIRIDSAAARSWDITADDSPDLFQVRNATANTRPFSISGVNGNVGIGTITPGYPLQVIGTVAAGSFVYVSDKRLKKSINTIDNPLEKILALRGVNFSWKENDDKDIGFIAQEVEKVEPRLVMTAKDGFKSVKYGNIAAILVEAIKELKRMLMNVISSQNKLDQRLTAQNELLQAQILELQKQNQALAIRLDRQEKQLKSPVK